jgi:isopentenyl-diphosphate Delta-isomerase
MINYNEVVLVDTEDREIGTMEKLQAHQEGVLHRAFSIFIFNSRGEMLIHQRAEGKYHSAGLWTNACCSHPASGEDLAVALKRRLKEEMHMQADMFELFSFVYKAELENGLTEHEFDHVVYGISDSIPFPNPEEVQAWKYVSIAELHADVEKNPMHYTEWFKLCYQRVLDHMDLSSTVQIENLYKVG